MRWKVKAPVNTLRAVGLRITPLIRADDQSVVLLAVVTARPRVTGHRQLVVDILKGGNGLSDEILVDDIDDRDVEADHLAELRAVRPGGVDDMLSNDPTLLGDDFPSTVGELIHVSHPVLAGDLSTELSGSGGHGVDRRARIGPSVERSVEAELDVRQVFDEWVEATDLIVVDQMCFDPVEIHDVLDVLEPVSLVVANRQSDGATSMPSRMQAGLRLDSLVQLDGLVVHLGHVQVADEVRNETGCMPRGAGRELVLFNEDRIGPALVGEVVQQANAHGAATNNHTPGFFTHVLVLFVAILKATCKCPTQWNVLLARNSVEGAKSHMSAESRLRRTVSDTWSIGYRGGFQYPRMLVWVRSTPRVLWRCVRIACIVGASPPAQMRVSADIADQPPTT